MMDVIRNDITYRHMKRGAFNRTEWGNFFEEITLFKNIFRKSDN